MKKGKKPAHHNAFAFKHNKNSKLTKKIAEEPLDVLCKRCIAKLKWRRKYRKFKLRTVPGRCNLCHEKGCYKGYRTVCDPCALARGLCAKCVKEPICVDIDGVAESEAGSEDENSGEEKKE